MVKQRKQFVCYLIKECSDNKVNSKGARRGITTHTHTHTHTQRKLWILSLITLIWEMKI